MCAVVGAPWSAGKRTVSCAVVGREANGAEVVVADVCTNKDAQCGHEKKPGKTEKKQKK